MKYISSHLQTPKIILMLLIFFISIYCFGSEKIVENRISLNFYQTETSLILQTLADHNQLNLVLQDKINHIQTVKLNNVRWKDALTVITQSAQLHYRIEDNFLIISQPTDPKILQEQLYQQQKDDELKLPLVYSSINISHAEAKAIMEILNEHNLLSDRGKIVIDDRTQKLIIYDIEKNHKKIKELIEQLDQPIPQIHIAAHIVTMSNESADELGIKWAYTKNKSQFLEQLDINNSVANATTTLGFNLAKRANNLLNLELTALEAENQLEIIASPNLLTSHQHTAYIKQGTEIPYEVSNDNNGATAIEFKQAVLGLEVTPRVLTNNQLELDLIITQNTTGRAIKRGDGGEALAINTQEIHTRVLVNNGETLILGGIFEQSQQQNQQAVPGISQIPVIGNFFKYKGKQWQKRELVIFITPQLVY